MKNYYKIVVISSSFIKKNTFLKEFVGCYYLVLTSLFQLSLVQCVRSTVERIQLDSDISTVHALVFFRISDERVVDSEFFFSLKPSRDQDGANKKRFSQIGPAVPELLSFRQTYIQTFRLTKILITF